MNGRLLNRGCLDSLLAGKSGQCPSPAVSVSNQHRSPLRNPLAGRVSRECCRSCIEVEVLARLGIAHDNAGACHSEWINTTGDLLVSYDPSEGTPIAKVRMATAEDCEAVVQRSVEIFQRWRLLPAPQRGEIVREIGDELRRHKAELGALVSIEMGKILQEGLGEVQEMIDISDFALGLSRQLYGLSMHSERAKHRMYEQWHPLGPSASSLPSTSRLPYGPGTR